MDFVLRILSLRFVGLWLALFLAAPAAFAGTVEVRVVGDNAYRLALGKFYTLFESGPPVENLTPAEVFDGADLFTVTSPSADRELFLIAWSDDVTTQGILVELQVPGHPPLLGGQGPWKVYATGNDFDTPSGGPTGSMVEDDLLTALLSSGAAETSQGWVPLGTTDRPPDHPGILAVGEDNGSDEG